MLPYNFGSNTNEFFTGRVSLVAEYATCDTYDRRVSVVIFLTSMRAQRLDENSVVGEGDLERVAQPAW